MVPSACSFHVGRTVEKYVIICMVSHTVELSNHVYQICKQYCKSLINLELHVVHVFLYARITAIEIMPC